MGREEYGLDPGDRSTSSARELVEVHASGMELALVIGGGNVYRGIKATAAGMDRATGDYMGMLATVLNSLAVQEALERNGGRQATCALCARRARGRRAVHPAPGDPPSSRRAA